MNYSFQLWNVRFNFKITPTNFDFEVFILSESLELPKCDEEKNVGRKCYSTWSQDNEIRMHAPFDLTRKCVKNIWCCWNVYVFHELTVACLLFWCCYFRERNCSIFVLVTAMHYMTYKEKHSAWSTENMFGFVLLWHAILACTNLSVAHFNLISRKQIGQPVFVDVFQDILTPWHFPSKWPSYRQMSTRTQTIFNGIVPMDNVLEMELCEMFL